LTFENLADVGKFPNAQPGVPPTANLTVDDDKDQLHILIKNILSKI